MTMPSLLAVTSELPWPLNTGGHLRTFHMLRALSRHYRVRLVTAVEGESDAAIDALRQHGIAITAVGVGGRRRWREALRMASAAAARDPYVMYQRHNRGPVRRALVTQAQEDPPDVLYMDHLDSFAYRSLLPRTPGIIGQSK